MAAGSGLRTKHFGACAKREVSRDRPWPYSMSGAGKPAMTAVAIVIALTTTFAGAVGTSTGRSTASGTTTSGPTFLSLSNGLVTATFPSAVPTFALTAPTNGALGLLQTLSGLAEVNSTGKIVAFAHFAHSGVVWRGSYANRSTESTASMAATVPAYLASGEWESGDDSAQPMNGSLGTVNVTLTFTLNDSSGASPTTVGYGLNVSGWPWQELNDSLGVQVITNATSTSAYWQVSGTNSVVERASGSGGTLGTYAWGSAATATYTNGNRSLSVVGAYHNISTNGLSSLVRLEFGTVSGGYRALGYDPWVSLTGVGPLARIVPAWLLGPDALATIGAGTVVSLALAAVALRRRRAPDHDL